MVQDIGSVPSEMITGEVGINILTNVTKTYFTFKSCSQPTSTRERERERERERGRGLVGVITKLPLHTHFCAYF